tara:strand:+ start:1426 stop:2538 length:1113 start_codon:yes stop_codon:yes gene_type:complete
MSGELEVAGLDSAGGWLRWRRKHADIPPGTPCANCETPLQGTYCHSCGQLAEDFHRSSWHLLVEAIESLLHLDGKLFRTLPGLVRAPGRLTRDYLEGRRAFQVQPFRMFLVVLLITLFVGHCSSTVTEARREAAGEHSSLNIVAPKMTAEDRAQARAEIQADPDMTPETRAAALAAVDGDWRAFSKHIASQASSENGVGDHATAPVDGNTGPNMTVNVDGQGSAIEHWIMTRYEAVQSDPERFALLLEIWGHRVAILALPVSALMLTLLFAFNRRYYVFDHLIFSMHSLSFQMILLTTIFLLSMLIGGWAWWLILLAPVHLFVHMKGAYQRSSVGTLARMAALFLMTSVTFTLLAMLWLYLGFNDMAGGH